MKEAIYSGFLIFVVGSPLGADTISGSFSNFGTPGLVEMPTADVREDAELGISFGGFENQQRITLNFQITPQLSGAFRYSRLDEFSGPGFDPIFDRSFDLHYQIFPEGSWRPALAVGLRDFMGTGIYTGEYVVATKTVTPRIRTTLGLGWGRLATEGGFENPLGAVFDELKIRPALDVGEGGEPSFDQFFRGDAALFGGVEWKVSEALTFTAEYSSDAYAREENIGIVERDTPLNFGLTFSPSDDFYLSAHWLGGVDFGLAATIAATPNDRVASSGFESAPQPVISRGSVQVTPSSTGLPESNVQATKTALARDGLRLTAITRSQRSVSVAFENERYRAEAQAVGRVARILTATMPRDIDSFTIIPTRDGIPISAVTIARSDLEALENQPDAAASMLARSEIAEAPLDIATGLTARDERLLWGISPFVALQLFDGRDPLRTEYGVQAALSYAIQPNLFLEGRARYRISGNRQDASIAASDLHPVRRNVGKYGEVGTVGIENLALHWYGRPGEALYSRASLGYLETMFAGASTELLWKPVDSRLALGAELNYVVQREYDLGFGAQSFDDIGGTYDVVTGHASLYYAFENGFHGQVDVGRYLAGDWGATFRLDREFANGWKVGAYATFTDVPFEEFGEGSFDKGFRITVPFDWALGNATRDSANVSLASLSRDGGARLRVDGRLYERIRGSHEVALTDGWGRFWR
ncbi:YjbH domain-containing protein [Yoonia litorea]|uniref:Exopolysaccharide biosynthesis protein YbjH n=1 Tax=Yoonia litorea TaxID=1123755 RepID=A0A1I6LNY7_9RHOB|nr:YjbH domain-containing protein [Yoonia litorea]SFS05175.1 Exopolysaccharide biosynthesis protein YbjH [Yoonia litorea]